MIRNLAKIFNTVDNEIDIPNEWEKMEILSINKKGSKMKMENKRGLFLTNNVSKVYEKVLKERNREEFKEGITE